MAAAVEQKSKIELGKILDVGKVDVGNGTLFGVSRKRAARRNGLTLVISTGGSGMRAIQEAMRIADQKLEVDYKNFVKFIVVDSSTGEIEGAEKSGIKTLNISSPGAIDRMRYERRETFFRQFMPADYAIQLINPDGASQDRMTGKMKLYDRQKGTTNDSLFRTMIQDLFHHDWAPYSNLPVDIVILSGLSGGNGSGTFMDLAVQAKNACPDKSRVTVYGYLMLPDTAEKFASSDDAKKSLHGNGFAALKELEAYMSLCLESQQSETIPSNVETNTVTLDATNLPFNYPVLISGNYKDAVSMIGETIVTLAADSDGRFEQKAFYSNLLTQRDNVLARDAVSSLGVLKADACPEDSHMYCGIGYAYASIPEKIVIPNVVSRVCGKLYVAGEDTGISGVETKSAFCSQERHLSRHEFEQQIRRLFSLDGNAALNSQSLWKKLEAQLRNICSVKENQWDVSLRDLVNGEYGEYLEGFEVSKRSIEGTEKIIQELKKMYEGFLRGASGVMTQYGPRAMEYLYSGTGDTDEQGVPEDFSDISIKTMLDTVTGGLTTTATTPGKYPDRIPQVGLITTAIEAVFKKKVDEWKGKAKSAAEQDIRSQVAGRMTGASGSWKREFSEKIEHFIGLCKRFADVLETMTAYYSSEGKSLDTADFQEFAKSTGERNGVNLCADAGMYQWVRQRVDEKINAIRIADVKDALVQDFMAHSELWVSDDQGKARKQYDEVMSRCCAVGRFASADDGLHLTITDYFAEILKDVPAEQQQTRVNNVMGEIMAKLLQSSRPSLEMRQESPCINKTILLPESLKIGEYWTLIENAVRPYLTGENDNFSDSSAVDAIVCYQTSVANPLCGLKNLPLWEIGYERTADGTIHLCNGEYYSQYTELTKKETDEHLGVKTEGTLSKAENELFGTGLSWEHYPSPNLLAYQSDFKPAGDISTRENKYRRGIFNARIEYALKEKIIECEENGNQYRYYLNIIPSDWTNLSVRGYRQVSGGKYKRGAELFEYLKNQNPHSAMECRKDIRLQKTPFFEEAFDFTGIIQMEHWTRERVTETHVSYMKRIMRKNIYLYRLLEETLYRYYEIEKELLERETEFRDSYQTRVFAELFAYSVIDTDEDAYDWNVKLDGRGSNSMIVNFGRRTTAKMVGLEKALNKDNLRLAIVYGRFDQMVKNQELYLDRLEELKQEIIDALSDKEFDKLLEERTAFLKKEYETYQKLFGSAKDPVGELMEAYGLEDGDIDEASRVDKLYQTVKEVMEEL